jgi:hypothetical protein
VSRAADLIIALQTRLGAIRKGATLTVSGRSYTVQTDYGRPGCLVLRRQTPLGEKESDLLNLWPGIPRRMEERGEFGLDRYRLEIGVEILARGKGGAETVAAAADDILQAVNSDRRFGGLARWAGVEFQDLSPELLAQSIYGLPGTISIEYVTNSGEV